ncbi:ankyrin repeat domain-containing protein [Aspergillus udagawae]|uniref:Uncharacterized protein n=1 Tax=Aspergillus udagawae TaxID=91492 RepID=A0A8E0R0T8_9EURO|nr:uncharacterized protein Aud_008932 [Aspergillus udagawae]GIC92466.1 hypothetical protein Aud_008932 [Aspergillus udagawae]
MRNEPAVLRQGGASHGLWSRSTAFQRGRQHVTLVNATRSMKCMLIAKLLERGFDANEKSDTGETPLSLAVAAGYLEVAELLLRHGAEPNMRIGSFPSLLLLAIAKGYVEVADVLRKYGAKEMCEEIHVDEEDYLAGVAECCRLSVIIFLPLLCGTASTLKRLSPCM